MSTELTFILDLQILDEKIATFFKEDDAQFPSINVVKNTWIELGRPTRLSVKLEEYSPTYLTIEDL